MKVAAKMHVPSSASGHEIIGCYPKSVISVRWQWQPGAAMIDRCDEVRSRAKSERAMTRPYQSSGSCDRTPAVAYGEIRILQTQDATERSRRRVPIQNG